MIILFHNRLKEIQVFNSEERYRYLILNIGDTDRPTSLSDNHRLRSRGKDPDNTPYVSRKEVCVDVLGPLTVNRGPTLTETPLDGY